MNKFEIKKQKDGWFAIFNIESGALVHIGSTLLKQAEGFLVDIESRETPVGKAEWLRVNTHRNNFTGD